MYWNQYPNLNPATTALEHEIDARVTYRNQWPSLTGNVRSLSMNYNMLVKGNHGLGANFTSDKIAYSRSSTFQFNYNYQLKFSKQRRLSFGVSPGIQQLRLSGNWIPPTTTEDPSLPEDVNDVSFNLNAGIAFKGKSIMGGFGVTHLTAQKYVSANGLTSYTSRRHYYAHARYTLRVGRKTNLYAEGILRTDAVFTSFDVNLKTRFLNQFWVGLGYRNHSTCTTFLGWDIKEKFHVAYSYDITISKLNNGISGGSHEMTASFKIPHRQPKPHGISHPNF